MPPAAVAAALHLLLKSKKRDRLAVCQAARVLCDLRGSVTVLEETFRAFSRLRGHQLFAVMFAVM